MGRKMIFLLVVLSVFTAQAVCSADVPMEDIARVEKKYASINDYQATFEQKTVLSAAGQTIHGAGQVYIKKGGKIRWEYTTPEPQIFIMDGRSFWLYLPEERQAMKDDYSVVPEHILIDLFGEEVNILKNFKLISSAYPEDAPAFSIKLKPYTETPSVKYVTLYIDRQKHHILQTVIKDEFGNTTTIAFSDITVDSGIDDDLFEFVPPDDVEIFRPF